MTQDTPPENTPADGRADPDSPAALAARRFAQALAWTDLLAVTARVEATLHAAGALEELFALEDGFRRAWTSGRPPFCEMLWAGEGAGLDLGALRLSAFDEAGRVLLRRTYPARLKPAATAHG
jgi:hypothetical protein